MTPPRRLGTTALVTMTLLAGGCLGDMIEKFTSDMVEKHAPKPGSTKGGGSEPRRGTVAVAVVTISEASQTPQCRAEVSTALEAMRDELGLAIKVEDVHIDALFTQGTTAIPYARDGIRHIPEFRFRQANDACALQFYKRTTVRPGETESMQADYGSVELKVCTCQ